MVSAGADATPTDYGLTISVRRDSNGPSLFFKETENLTWLGMAPRAMLTVNQIATDDNLERTTPRGDQRQLFD